MKTVLRNIRTLLLFVPLLFAYSATSQATNINLGPLGIGDLIVSNVIVYSNGDDVDDTFSFNLIEDASTFGAVFNFEFEDIYAFSELNLQFGANPVVDLLSIGNGEFVSFGSLLAGNYSFTVSGTASGSLGGQYLVGVTAVPEPNVWALMIAGLGIIGISLKRRNSQIIQPNKV